MCKDELTNALANIRANVIFGLILACLGRNENSITENLEVISILASTNCLAYDPASVSGLRGGDHF